MHKLRIYIDTSVIGGCFDKPFEYWSNLLFEEFISGKKTAVISRVTVDEVSQAPENVIRKLEEIPTDFLEVLIITDEARNLAEQYIFNKVVTRKFYEDALHIALATIAKVDVLVSWNFRHIVNLGRISKYNDINKFNGFKELEIRTPMEVLK
jgi:hypothetical protein